MATRVTIQETTPKQLLQRTSGYLTGYDYSLNPYVGCVFACSYCYVRSMPVARFHAGEWGTYVDAKRVMQDHFQKELIRARKRGSVNIFMSSSTDPYQPAESRFERTRSILTCLSANLDLFDFLFIQTRSPLVTRDIDLLQHLGDRVLVSITIETDREDVRERFTPFAPKLAQRKMALQALHASHIPTQVAVSPILPATEQFAEQFVGLADYVVIDDYFMGDGNHGQRTKQLRLENRYTDEERSIWYNRESIGHVEQQFLRHFDRSRVFISRIGFLPPGLRDGASAEENDK